MAEALRKPEVLIREAVLDDAPRLMEFFSEIEAACRDVSELFRFQALERFLEAIAHGDTLVADQDGEILGMVSVSTEKPGYCALGNLVVDVKARGRGLGHELVAAGHRLARQRGAHTAILLIFNFTGAQGFYELQGYREIGRWMEMAL